MTRWCAVLTLALLLTSSAAAQDDPSWVRERGELSWLTSERNTDGDGAWAIRHRWTERIDPVDPDSPTYADQYDDWVLEHADEWVAGSVRRDCADFSISLMVTYAHENGLPVNVSVYFSHLRRMVTVSSREPRFLNFEHFEAWILWHLGAMNVADNTLPVTYETWRAGDMVLMDWNQTDTSPNFPGRTVWHTYLVGEPGQTAYYGNISDGNPLPITKLDDPGYIRRRMQEHPDIHGGSPRRWQFMVSEPEPAYEALEGTASLGQDAVLLQSDLSERPDPIAHLALGTTVSLLGKAGLWMHVEVDGQQGWLPNHALAAPVDEPHRVVPRALNVRAAPSVMSGKVGMVYRDQEVRVLGWAGRWAMIAREDGGYGWIHGGYLERLPEEPAATPDGRGITDALGEIDQ